MTDTDKRADVVRVKYALLAANVNAPGLGDPDALARAAIEAMSPALPDEPKGQRCAATISFGDNGPGECNWPNCGCDPEATRVMQDLQECGMLCQPGELSKLRAEIANLQETASNTFIKYVQRGQELDAKDDEIERLRAEIKRREAARADYMVEVARLRAALAAAKGGAA